MSDQTKMTSRIPVTPELQKFLREYASGLGTTYDEALKYMFRDIWATGDDPLLVGRQQRTEFVKWQLQQIIDEDEQSA